jgi:hypothetical protein
VRHAPYLLQPPRYPQEYSGDEIEGRNFDVGNVVADGLLDGEPAPETYSYAACIVHDEEARS